MAHLPDAEFLTAFTTASDNDNERIQEPVCLTDMCLPPGVLVDQECTDEAVLIDDFFGADGDFSAILAAFEASDENEETDYNLGDDLSSSNTPTVNSDDTPSPSTVETTHSLRRKPPRKRRKHELDRLRALIAALERKLTALKIKTQPNETASSIMEHQSWQRVTAQMLAAKQRAMGENARLREIMHEQIKIVRGLQRSLAKSPDLSKLGIFPRIDQRINPVESSSKALYKSMLESIMSSYQRMDSVFAQADVPDPRKSSRKLNMEMQTEGDCRVMCIQVVESRVVPCSFLFIGDMAWEYLAKENDERQRTGFYLGFESFGDVMFGDCAFDSPSERVKLEGKVALRRFKEKNRLTFVWEFLGPAQTDFLHPPAVRLLQKGWFVFEPSEDDPLNTSVCRTCIHFTPTPEYPGDSINTNAMDVGLTTGLVLSVFEKTVGYIFESVVNSLLKNLLYPPTK